VSELARIVEALLFLSPEAVSLADLAQAAACDEDEIATALAERDREYAPGARGLQL
jgi:chromosome segregation and condensation protein ScpB